MALTFDTDWDVEKYRTKFESEEHWALKRDFMIAHQGTFSEERLICLAQVFVNMELLRCKYPDAVVQQVSILAKEIGHDYKKNQKTRLQRTFVQASDAANAKVRGEKRKYAVNESNKLIDISTKKNELHENFRKFDRETVKPIVETNYNWQQKLMYSNSSFGRHYNAKQTNLLKPQRLQGKACPSSVPHGASSQMNSRIHDPLSKIVIRHLVYIQLRFFQLLDMSMVFSKIPYDTKFVTEKGLCCCTFFTKEGRFLGSGTGTIPAFAKESGAKDAISRLLNICYVVKQLRRPENEQEIHLEEEAMEKGVSAVDDGALSADNMGAKLLKMMGWTGGGLGKDGEGRVEPVQATKTIGRSGLGLKTDEVTQDFIFKVRNILKDYMKSSKLKDLVFSSDLSSDQRKKIHSLSAQMGRGSLKSQSLGKGESRHLTVTRKMNVRNCLHVAKTTDKYELLEPGTITVEDLIREEEARQRTWDDLDDIIHSDRESPRSDINLNSRFSQIGLQEFTETSKFGSR